MPAIDYNHQRGGLKDDIALCHASKAPTIDVEVLGWKLSPSDIVKTELKKQDPNAILEQL